MKTLQFGREGGKKVTLTSSLPISQMVWGLVNGFLFLLFPSVAAVVVVVVSVLCWSGMFIEMGGMGALWVQCGDGALHGACVRNRLWTNTRKGR